MARRVACDGRAARSAGDVCLLRASTGVADRRTTGKIPRWRGGQSGQGAVELRDGRGERPWLLRQATVQAHLAGPPTRRSRTEDRVGA